MNRIALPNYDCLTIGVPVLFIISTIRRYFMNFMINWRDSSARNEVFEELEVTKKKLKWSCRHVGSVMKLLTGRVKYGEASSCQSIDLFTRKIRTSDDSCSHPSHPMMYVSRENIKQCFLKHL